MSADRTPAPVAVPEGGWQDGDEVVRILSQGFQVGARGDGAWRFSTAATATEWTDEDVDWMVETERVAAIYLTPRPEPVVAPLPTEAVEEASEVLYRNAANASWDPDGQPSWEDAGDEVREAVRVDARDVLTAALPHLRLVPEDSEDTVRVPREAVERLRAAVGPYIPETAADADLDAAAWGVVGGPR